MLWNQLRCRSCIALEELITYRCPPQAKCMRVDPEKTKLVLDELVPSSQKEHVLDTVWRELLNAESHTSFVDASCQTEDAPCNAGCRDGVPTEVPAKLGELLRLVEASCLDAMPYEVVDAPLGSQTSADHEKSMAIEMHRAVESLPTDFQDGFRARVDSLVESVMQAARKEKVSIGLALQKQWPVLPDEVKQPWEMQYKERLDSYQKAKENFERGFGPEPRRPPSPFFAWIGSKMREEWDSRRPAKHSKKDTG